MRKRHIFLILSLLLVAGALGTLLWLRHRAWADRWHGGGARIGALAGVLALAIAVVAGTPLLEALGEPVVWSTWPIVRGSGTQAEEPSVAGREKLCALLQAVLEDEAFIAAHLTDETPERKILYEDKD